MLELLCEHCVSCPVLLLLIVYWSVLAVVRCGFSSTSVCPSPPPPDSNSTFVAQPCQSHCMRNESHPSCLHCTPETPCLAPQSMRVGLTQGMSVGFMYILCFSFSFSFCFSLSLSLPHPPVCAVITGSPPPPPFPITSPPNPPTRTHAECPQLLDVEDMVRMREPDWKCVYTYIQEYYRCLVQKGLVKTKKS